MVSCLKVMFNVLFAWNSNKIKACHEHKKIHDLNNKKKGLFDRKSLVELYAKVPTRLKYVETKIKKFCKHDQIEVVIFWQNKNRLHSITMVQFPFGQPSHKIFCRNAGLWGSWPCLPLISSGWFVIRVWTMMIGRLEGTSPELFPIICSSKLEVSHTCL